MKTAVMVGIAIILSAVVTFFILKSTSGDTKQAFTVQRLLTAQQTVQKRLDDYYTQIESQLKSFADVVATHKDFSLKILVENDRSALVVTELAGLFLKPMGFSVLEITDSSRTILSSGHFPASAGNKSLHQAHQLSKNVLATTENIMGLPTLTLQAEYNFSIAGFSFFVTGGVTVDDKLLARLAPNDQTILLLKKGENYTGMDNISSISAITDNQIIINDKKYPAAEIEVPSSGVDEKISIIVLLK
jgi:hypothetical protein